MGRDDVVPPVIERRINIAVMLSPTFRVLPYAFVKRHLRHFVTTTMVLFRTGKHLVEFYQMNAFFYRLVLQLCDEAMPSSQSSDA